MLIIVSVNLSKGSANWSNIIGAILNIAMFTMLYLVQRDIVRKYEKQDKTDDKQ